jgi:hypothetical protein
MGENMNENTIIQFSRNLGFLRTKNDGSIEYTNGFSRDKAFNLYKGLHKVPGSSSPDDVLPALLLLYKKSLRAENIKLINENSGLGYRYRIFDIIRDRSPELFQNNNNSQSNLRSMLEKEDFSEKEIGIFMKQNN